MAAASPQTSPSTGDTGWVLIPVKDFTAAKGRLAAALEPAERVELAQAMATHVVRAQRNTKVAICCDDDAVAAWATSVDARVIWCPDTDLNGAVQHGYAVVSDEGASAVAIAHSDLPLATDLTPLLGWPGVTIVPDRHFTGTNVLVLPARLPVTFAYGTGSFRRHAAEAVRLRRGLRIVHDPSLGWDIDEPADLAGADSTRRYLERNRP